ncbi:MAG: tetratricopeptide repeat protein [Gemmataceae bacterium]|nr:tetratricopeptide repeat protein [Gemmataceae bacterium]
MSRTLNLIRRLLARARKLHNLGVEQEALILLGRIASFHELPPGVAEEVQRRQAELLLKRRKYLRARRHLAALLNHDPANPHYHFLMGRAVERDPRADPKRAVEHYRRSLDLRPAHASYLASFGLAALRAGRKREALTALRRALDVAPNDPSVMARVVDGLGQLGRYREAGATLRAALFRNPREPRFQRLYRDLRFRQVCDEQQAARRLAAAPPADEGAVLLPFIRPTEEASPGQVGLKVLRHDGSATLPHPHLPRPARKAPDQKHAQ